MGEKVVLRDYQQDLFNQLIKMPKTNVMVQLEAGAGKTYIELYLAEYLVKHGYKVAICTPWTLIRDQIQEKSWLDPKQVEITSAQILLNQGDNLPNYDYLIFDEAHHSVAKTYVKLYKKLPNTYRIGFTATPMRNDKKSLGDYYDQLIESPITTRELIERGYLAKFKYYAPDVESDLSNGFSKDEHGNYGVDHTVYGSIVQNWKKYGENRQTIVFAPTIETSNWLAKQFNQAGAPAESISSYDNAHTINSINAFRNKEIKIICNYDIISEGFDMADCDCVVLTYQTGSYLKFYQRVYRALRKSNNDWSIVIDHGNNFMIHGRIDDRRDFTLNAEPKNDRGRAKHNPMVDGGYTEWAFEYQDQVELKELYRVGQEMDDQEHQKYQAMIDHANKLHNLEGLKILFQVQHDLNINSRGNVAWAWDYALKHGYEVEVNGVD